MALMCFRLRADRVCAEESDEEGTGGGGTLRKSGNRKIKKGPDLDLCRKATALRNLAFPLLLIPARPTRCQDSSNGKVAVMVTVPSPKSAT